MTRRHFVGMPAGLPVAMAAQPAQTARKGSRPPNILFIISDQMTPFMTGPYGSGVARTPHLDRLAREGAVFENAYCNSPLCVPSRNSMWSGRLVSAIGAFDNGSEFPAHLPTIPYMLRSSGYRTAAAGKCHFIGADQLHGFDERLTPCIFPAGFEMTPDWRQGAYYNRGTSMQQMLRMLGPSKWNRQLAFDEHCFDQSMARLRAHSLGTREQPLFLTVSFTQPHDPFTTTKEFLDLYANADIPMPNDHGDIRRLSPTYEWFVIHHGTGREKLPAEKVREARRNYLGMISWIDDKVGLLLAELDRLALADDTVVVFTSDHGEMLGEHGQWSKRLLLEWSARVPLLVKLPGKASAGRRIAQPVSLLDLLPTFNELAGVKTDLPFDGQSLVPLLKGGPENTEAAVISEYLGEGSLEPMRMVRMGWHKYITVNGHPPQLYDLREDPEETVNIAGRVQQRAVEKTLHERAMQGWDGAQLKKSVLADQQQRLLVREIARTSGGPKWDYAAATTGPYLR